MVSFCVIAIIHGSYSRNGEVNKCFTKRKTFNMLFALIFNEDQLWKTVRALPALSP